MLRVCLFLSKRSVPGLCAEASNAVSAGADPADYRDGDADGPRTTTTTSEEAIMTDPIETPCAYCGKAFVRTNPLEYFCSLVCFEAMCLGLPQEEDDHDD